MILAVAARIDSESAPRLIEFAAQHAAVRQVEVWYLISIVSSLPYGVSSEAGQDVVARNLGLVAARGGRPIMHEGTDVAQSILEVAHFFRVSTLFLGGGSPHFVGKSINQRLLLSPRAFDLVIVPAHD